MPSVEPLFLSEVEMRDICPFHETLAAIRYLVDQTVYKVYRGTFIFVVNRYHGHLHSVYTLRYDLIRGARPRVVPATATVDGGGRQQPTLIAYYTRMIASPISSTSSLSHLSSPGPNRPARQSRTRAPLRIREHPPSSGRGRYRRRVRARVRGATGGAAQGARPSRSPQRVRVS